MCLRPRFDAPLPRIPCLARDAERLPCLQLDFSAFDLVTDLTYLLRFSANRLQVWRGIQEKMWIWSLDPRAKRHECGRIDAGELMRQSGQNIRFRSFVPAVIALRFRCLLRLISGAYSVRCSTRIYRSALFGCHF